MVDCDPAYKVPAPLIPVASADPNRVIEEHDELIVNYGVAAKRLDKLIECINDWAKKTRPK